MNQTAFNELLKLETKEVSDKFNAFNAPEEVKSLLLLFMINSIKDSLKRLIIEKPENREMLLVLLNSEQSSFENLLINILDMYDNNPKTHKM